jgi:hypothetical protein
MDKFTCADFGGEMARALPETVKEIVPDSWDESTVIVCDECNAPMLPNVSTMDEEGCGWICLSFACDDYTGDELESDDLVAVGVPEWVARRVCGLVDRLGGV